MILDQISLLTAVGFSSAALCVTIFLAWIGTRNEQFLLSWSAGMAMIVVGTVLFSAFERYDALLQFASFVMLIIGFAAVYLGAMQYRSNRPNWLAVCLASGPSIAFIGLLFSVGLTGVGTIAANAAMALLLGLSAHQYWAGRAEAPVPMTTNAILYAITAASFLLCCVPLLLDRQLVMAARPSNWAEDINAIVAIFGLSGIGAVSLALNQARIARRHREDAMTDGLTGLLNRRAVFEHFAAGFSAPLNGVIVLDLDHFKRINDTFGHATGDSVLRRFAEILRQNLRAGDVAARIGGEEFCIVLPGVGAGVALRSAERIRMAVEADVIETPNGQVKTTVSAGFAMSTSETELFEALLNRADMALYQAKEDGRNRVRSFGPRLVA